jgi:spore cortex formation protein SpoVR/YcgB (stage V sporulation)/intein/homing endonuclease
MSKLLFDGHDWNFNMLQHFLEVSEQIGVQDLGMKLYTNQVEIISSEQMLDAYSSVGMPIMYNHWSFGKRLVKDQHLYRKGHMGLAYELVINSDPAIAYCMEDNSAMMQLLVIAHASVGHNFCFANNYMFRKWTDADAIIDYLKFAKNYVRECEYKYGVDQVEQTLDSLHALDTLGVDKYQRAPKLNAKREADRQRQRLDEWSRTQTEFWMKMDPNVDQTRPRESKILDEPQENLLYFLEKHSPILKPWQKELTRIVRKISQYWWPQRNCVTGNHLISTPKGLLRFDELIHREGHHPTDTTSLLTIGNKITDVSHLFKNPAKVLRIKTRMGRRITATPEHPLMTFRDNQRFMCEMRNLKLGDHLPTYLNYDIFAKTEPELAYTIDSSKIKCALCGLESHFIGSHVVQAHQWTTEQYKDKFGILTSDTRAITKSANRIQKIPTHMTPDLAELIAMLTYGNIGKSNSIIKFDHAIQDIAERFRDLVNSIFGLNVTSTKNKWGNYEVEFSSYTLKRFVLQNCPEIMVNKYVAPKIIRTSKQESVQAWIRTFMDLFAAKSRSNNQKIIHKLCAYDSDYEFLEQLQTMLIGFGIISRIYSTQRLTFNGFASVLGIDITSDQGKEIANTLTLQVICDHNARYKERIGSYYSINDQEDVSLWHKIPGAGQLLRTVRSTIVQQREIHAKTHDLKKNYKFKVANKMSVCQNFISTNELPEIGAEDIYYSHLIRFKDKFENLGKVHQVPEADQLRKLISDSHEVFYDEIISIESLDETCYVYDVTVPENHLFWMDGIISHNTKLLNEGIATYTHYYILNQLYDQGRINDSAQLEWLSSHAAVIYQPPYDHKRYSGINPYALGFAIFKDIRRMCENPTQEDRKWFPKLAGADWRAVIRSAATEYRDDAFVHQWLSPRVARDLRLFSIEDDHKEKEYVVKNIHNTESFERLRSTLAHQYDVHAQDPQIYVVEANLQGDRILTLEHRRHKGQELNTNTSVMLEHVRRLWGYPVLLRSVDNQTGTVISTYRSS